MNDIFSGGGRIGNPECERELDVSFEARYGSTMEETLPNVDDEYDRDELFM